MAHTMCDELDTVSGAADLNALWTDLYRDYRSDSFNYAFSKAITLSLFKQYRR